MARAEALRERSRGLENRKPARIVVQAEAHDRIGAEAGHEDKAASAIGQRHMGISPGLQNLSSLGAEGPVAVRQHQRQHVGTVGCRDQRAVAEHGDGRHAGRQRHTRDLGQAAVGGINREGEQPEGLRPDCRMEMATVRADRHRHHLISGHAGAHGKKPTLGIQREDFDHAGLGGRDIDEGAGHAAVSDPISGVIFPRPSSYGVRVSERRTTHGGCAPFEAFARFKHLGMRTLLLKFHN